MLGAASHFRRMEFRPAEVRVRKGRNGVVYLQHPREYNAPARNLVDLLAQAIRKHGSRPFMHERSGAGWSGLSYAEFGARVARCASALSRQGVQAGDVVAILARNSIDHAVANFAVMALGAVVAPLSPAYVAQPSGRSLLLGLLSAIGPKLLLLDAAIAELAHDAGFDRAVGLSDLMAMAGGESIDLKLAAAKVQPNTMAKVLFTSGSTGTPKAVGNSHAMLVASAAMVDAVSPRLPDGKTPVIVDWLPWHHTYGGNINVHIVMLRGGAFYIDDGLPTPALFQRTLENLASVQPTQITEVPIAYPMLIDALKRDADMARRVLKNVHACSFGGAALSPSVVEAFQNLARETIGQKLTFGSGYGMTETGGIIALTYWATERTDLLGLPLPGETLKLVPCDDDRYECRVSGPNIFGGYLNADVSVFDEEGYFCTGDAVRKAGAGWKEGLTYDGRLAEDFKLASGVWVRVGPLREAYLDALRPFATGVLICGANRDAVGALVWFAPGGDGHMREIEARTAAFNSGRRTPSTRIAHVAVAASPPTPAEVTAKGTLNAARATTNRRAEIDALFENQHLAVQE